MHSSMLKGGRYDGDQGDVGYWPISLWAFVKDPDDLGTPILWETNLDSDQLRYLRERRHDPQCYIRSEMQGSVMIYTWQEMLNGPPRALVGAGIDDDFECYTWKEPWL